MNIYLYRAPRKRASQLQDTIRDKAMPFYSPTDFKGWPHIQQVERTAQAMTKKLYNRSLTPQQRAAIYWHDSTKQDLGGKDHGRLGAARAAKLLATILTPEQIHTVSQAIGVHDDNLKKFPSQEAELLASADANPPDLDFLINKSYNYNLKRHPQDIKAGLRTSLQAMKQKYGTKGSFNWPGIYRDYYGDQVVKDYQKAADALTQQQEWARLRRYRKKHHIPMGAIA